MGIFNKVKLTMPGRSVFDLSHERKFSMNMGELIPIFCEDVVPGDTFKMNTEVLMRLAPMISPVMHRVNVYTHFFYVPYRLIWADFQKFITGGEDGLQKPVLPTYTVPTGVQISNLGPGSLSDYLGVASTIVASGADFTFNALPFRAYKLIVQEYYRDQNLQPAIVGLTTSGDYVIGTAAHYFLTIDKRGWEKDYFTSALPWTQRGGDVVVPMGDVYLKPGLSALANYPKLKDGSYSDIPAGATVQGAAGGQIGSTASSSLRLDPNGSLGVDAGTVEDLRRATRLQEWLEKNARGGSRYIEQILSHFGVKSSDARLQRPEFLGGGKSPIVISEVLQTSKTDTSPQGNMAGHGVGVGNTHSFKKFFEEHGVVIGIMSVLPRTAYQQGTRRMFFKSDKYDFYWPEFAQLGEQPVYNDEIYTTFNNANRGTVFGYQSRYAEYKYIPSSVHGDMKGSLSYWHMGRIFSSAPALNGSFVQSDPTHRIFSVTDPAYDKLYVQVYNNLKAVRPMPYFNQPTL